MTLQARDVLPMFTATTLDGIPFAYQELWQHKSLLLVSIPDVDRNCASDLQHLLQTRGGELHSYDVQVVVTNDPVAGVPSPGVVVADRWGEIYFIQGADRASALPTPDELIAWVRFVSQQCPECEGEAR